MFGCVNTQTGAVPRGEIAFLALEKPPFVNSSDVITKGQLVAGLEITFVTRHLQSLMHRFDVNYKTISVHDLIITLVARKFSIRVPNNVRIQFG